MQYLVTKGISEENLVFSTVNSKENSAPLYGPNGNSIGSIFTGYTLSQSVEINNKDVEGIERVSREITELLNQGLQLYSESPRYYYTKIEDLKVEMILRQKTLDFVQKKMPRIVVQIWSNSRKLEWEFFKLQDRTLGRTTLGVLPIILAPRRKQLLLP
jgi:hypothetical protein